MTPGMRVDGLTPAGERERERARVEGINNAVCSPHAGISISPHGSIQPGRRLALHIRGQRALAHTQVINM